MADSRQFRVKIMPHDDGFLHYFDILLEDKILFKSVFYLSLGQLKADIDEKIKELRKELLKSVYEKSL